MWCIQINRLGSEHMSLECEAYPSNVSFYGKLSKTHFIPVSPHRHGCSPPGIYDAVVHVHFYNGRWAVEKRRNEAQPTERPLHVPRCSSFHLHESEPCLVQTLLSTLSSALRPLCCQCVGDKVQITDSDEEMQIMTTFSHFGNNWFLVRCSKRNSYQCPSFGAPLLKQQKSTCH